MELFNNSVLLSTDKKKIVSTGSVFQFEEEDLLFQIFSLNVRITFVSVSGKNAKTETCYFENTNEYKITLCNYDNDLGVGLSQPMEIGEVEEKKLYLIFRVYTLSKMKKNHLVHYTFFLEK